MEDRLPLRLAADWAGAAGGFALDPVLALAVGQLEPALRAGCDPERPSGAEVEVVGRPPRSSLNVASHVLTVREDTGGLLCRGEDRIHAGNLAVVAEGHADDSGRGVPGHHGQLVEAAAALALRPDRAMARVVQVHHACQLLSGRNRAAEEPTMPGAPAPLPARQARSLDDYGLLTRLADTARNRRGRLPVGNRPRPRWRGRFRTGEHAAERCSNDS
jgi:hypothetical protein